MIWKSCFWARCSLFICRKLFWPVQGFLAGLWLFDMLALVFLLHAWETPPIYDCLQTIMSVLCFFKTFVHYFSLLHQMIALQILWKRVFISPKSSFCSQDIQIFVFPYSPFFLTVGHCFRGWSKINLKVYDVINCLNENLILHFFLIFWGNK